MRRKPALIDRIPMWVGVVVILALIGGWVMWQWKVAGDRAERTTSKQVCEIINESQCRYDERFNEWVPK